MKQKLKGVSETLLIPLWTRAIESKHSNPIIKDDKAVEIVECIHYDFSQFDNAWISQVTIAIRTMILDRETTNFIKKHPDGVVVNIGAGLDTRFLRVNNGRICWYDLDLPEPNRIKKNFLIETDNYKMIAKSVFDYSWINEINGSDQPVLLIAEGILMYFEEDVVKSLMDKLVATFPQAEMLLEIMTSALIKSKQHATVTMTNAEFKWGITSGKELERLNSKIRFLDEWNYFDFHKDRWRWIRWLALIPAFKNRFSNRIIHLRFGS